MWCRERPESYGSKENWDIMETHRFFARHSRLLTVLTPLPAVEKVSLQAKDDMPSGLKGLKVSICFQCNDAMLQGKLLE